MINAAEEPKEIWIHDFGHTRAYNNLPEEYSQRVRSYAVEGEDAKLRA
jgi:hypothetical protein